MTSSTALSPAVPPVAGTIAQPVAGSTRVPARGRSLVRLVARVLVPFLLVGACTTPDTATTVFPVPTGPPAPSAPDATSPTASGGLIPPDAASEDGGQVAAVEDAPPVAGPPRAVSLAWLDGAQPSGGIVTGDPGAQDWFGRIAGERAVLGDGWYRYFAPDGSLVGCTSAGRCVGIGADDSTAIVAAPGAAREVYAADGSYVGRFAADGDVLTPTASPEPLDQALASSGVDLAGLAEAAVTAPPFAGGITGDPHIVTMGGQRYTTQATGQFVARTGDGEHEIQVQFSTMPHRRDVSIVTAVAIGTGADTVAFDLRGMLTVNGQAVAESKDFEQHQLSGGVTLGAWPSATGASATLAVTWPDGGSVYLVADAALGLTLITHFARTGLAAGILGSEMLGTATDLATRSGAPAAAGGGIEIAVISWRVLNSDRLLPTSSDSPALPSGDPVVLDAGAQRVARKICADSGIRRGHDIAACSFDVALTGDSGFVPGHLALSTAAQAPQLPALFAARWPALAARPIGPGSSGLSGSLLGGAGTVADLPADQPMELDLEAGMSVTYAISLAQAGEIATHIGTACTATPITMPDQPAWRVFAAGGQPVSARKPLCGDAHTGQLAAGDYVVMLANASHGDPIRTEVQVTVG